MEGLTSLSSDGTYEIRVGSGFSGTELILKFLRSLAKFLLTKYGLKLVIVHCFACDNDPEVREFLFKEYPDLQLCFVNMADISDTTAFDAISKTQQIVPYVDLWSGGFVCKTKSNFNNSSRGTNPKGPRAKACVQQKAGATGETWAYTSKYIATALPPIVLLENLKELKNKSGAEHSDLDFIEKELGQHGYVPSSLVIHPGEYGSRNRKTRLWVVGFRGDHIGISIVCFQNASQ
jgi:site-specific DNA-cytosine methylase